MRVEAKRLIFLALCVLDRAHRDARDKGAKPDHGVRLALAVLYGFSRSGERLRYDRLWTNLASIAPRTVTFEMEAGNDIDCIIRDVGAPGTREFRQAIWQAGSTPPRLR